MMNFLITLKKCPGFVESFSWGSAWCSRFIHWIFFFIIKLVGTIVDLIQMIFYMFAGISVDERIDTGIVIDSTGEKTNILEYFVLNDQVTKIYVRLCLVAVVLIVIFTIFRIIKQDYFDKTGPRSKGPIFRNVCISCVTLILIPVIFYVLINASGALAQIVQSSMVSSNTQLLGTKLFFATIAWEEVPVGGIDKTQLIYLINQLASNSTTPTSLGTVYEINNIYNFEPNFTFVLSGNYKYLQFNDTLYSLNNAEALKNYLVGSGYQTLIEGRTGEELLFKNKESIFNLTFIWYGYAFSIFSITKILYKLILNVIQRIFFMLAHYIVAPAVVSRYVLDDGQSYKEWLQKTIKQGMRVVSSVVLLSLYVICVELILQIDFTQTLYGTIESYFGTGKTDPNAIAYTSNNLISTINMPGANYNVSYSLLLLANIGDILLKALLIVAASGSMLDLDEFVSKYLYADNSIDNKSKVGEELSKAAAKTAQVVKPTFEATKFIGSKLLARRGGDEAPPPPELSHEERISQAKSEMEGYESKLSQAQSEYSGIDSKANEEITALRSKRDAGNREFDEEIKTKTPAETIARQREELAEKRKGTDQAESELLNDFTTDKESQLIKGMASEDRDKFSQEEAEINKLDEERKITEKAKQDFNDKMDDEISSVRIQRELDKHTKSEQINLINDKLNESRKRYYELLNSNPTSGETTRKPSTNKASSKTGSSKKGSRFKVAKGVAGALIVGVGAFTAAAIVGAIAPSALDLFTNYREEEKKRKKAAKEYAKQKAKRDEEK